MRTEFIAEQDQSSGSRPRALRAYGINDDACSNEEQKLGIVHRMRTRIATRPVFTGTLAAIEFETQRIGTAALLDKGEASNT